MDFDESFLRKTAATHLFSTLSYCCLRNLSGIGTTKQASSVAANSSVLTVTLEVGRWCHYLFVDRKWRYREDERQ